MRSLFISFCLVSSFFLNAAIFTVSNNVTVGAEFLSLNDAIEVAEPNDTIYIHGSGTSYGNVTLTKPLVLIGEGFKPSGGFLPETKMGYLILDSTVNSMSLEGSFIIGVEISRIGNNTSGTYTNGNTTVNNVIIDRCELAPSGEWHTCGENWIYKNCRMSGGPLDIHNYNNIIISNGIFFDGYIQNSQQPSVLIKNNIWNSNDYILNNVSNATIQNNIFYKAWGSPWNASVANNAFENNAYITGIAEKSGNIHTNNISEVPFVYDSIFVASYMVKEESPLKNAGTDGKDIGIYGGMFPSPNLRGTPNLPRVFGIEIENAVVEPEGTLKVTVKVKSED